MKKNYLVVLTAILLVGITFSAVQVIRAATKDATVGNTPTPVGHSWGQIQDFDCEAGYCLQKNVSGTLTCESCGGTGYWKQLPAGGIYYHGSDWPGVVIGASGDITASHKLVVRADVLTSAFLLPDHSVGVGMISAMANGSVTSLRDGFGPELMFNIGSVFDITGNEIAYIAGIRDGADNSGALKFATREDGVWDEKMRISADGNVGIGTEAPGAKLDIVKGSSGNRDNWYFSDNRYTPVVVESDVHAYLYLRTPNNVGSGILFADTDETQGWSGAIEYSHVTDAFSFSTVSKINAMRIDKDGNVGIGTDDPKAKLDVAGAIKVDASAFRTETTEGFACMDISTNEEINGEKVQCNETNRGAIQIILNMCGDGTYRDSLCYCGQYGTLGTFNWICLISCP